MLVSGQVTTSAAAITDAISDCDRLTLLMLRAQDGDRDSFDVIVRNSRTAIFHYLYRMVRNQEIAEDLTQETFLRAYRGRDLYKPVARFETWLYRIATNVALNHLRTQKSYKHNITRHFVADVSCHWEAPDPRPNAENVLTREGAPPENSCRSGVSTGQAALRRPPAQVPRHGLRQHREHAWLLSTSCEVTLVSRV